MNVRIREARREDLPALVKLYSELSLDEPREDAAAIARYDAAFVEISGLPGHHVLVAEDDGLERGAVAGER